MKFKISYRKASTVLLSLLILAGIVLIVFAQNIKMIGVRSYVAGPRFYPIMIGVLTVVFCIFSLIEVWRKPDQITELENAQRPLVIFLIMVAWGIFWQTIGNFYLVSAIFAGLMMFYMNPEPISLKKAIKSILQSCIIMLIVYLIFSVILKIRI
jgi:hypothetical protein